MSEESESCISKSEYYSQIISHPWLLFTAYVVLELTHFARYEPDAV